MRKCKTQECAFIGHDFTTRGGRKACFRKAISLALKGSSYKPLYSDTGRREPNVLIDITKKIENSKLCVFDLTGYKQKDILDKNLNVILELGISIGLAKQSYIVYKEKSIDFKKELSDLLGQYVYPYKTYKQLQEELKEFIKTLEL
jgi:hypothetical protein